MVALPRVPCSHCGSSVEIPPAHAEALRASEEDQQARAEAAGLLEKLADEVPVVAPSLGIVLILLLPSLATFAAAHVESLHWSALELSVYGALPALLPGFGLYVWAAGAQATSARFCDALSALPLEDEPGSASCRSCAAPLARDASAPEAQHVIRCPYCRCDNLLRNFHADALQAGLRSSLQTLSQALGALRTRRALLGLAIAFACGAMLVLSLVVRLAIA